MHQKVAVAEVNNQKVNVRAPAYGCMRHLHIGVGEHVNAGQPIALFAVKQSEVGLKDARDRKGKMTGRERGVDNSQAIRAEIAMLMRKKQEIMDIVALSQKKGAAETGAGEGAAPEALVDMQRELDRRIALERRKLMEIFKKMKEKEARKRTKVEHEAAAMDGKPFQRMCAKVPVRPLATIKYTPSPQELLKGDGNSLLAR